MNARDLDKLAQGSLPLEVFLVEHRGTKQVVRACETWSKGRPLLRGDECRAPDDTVLGRRTLEKQT